MSFSGSPVHYLGLPDLVFAACSQVGLPTQKSRSRGTQYAFAIKISHGHYLTTELFLNVFVDAKIFT